MIFGILYSPVRSSFAVRVLEHRRNVHRRIPAHVGHVHEQHVDRIGIGLGRVGDDHVHQAVSGERRIPRISLVDALRFGLRIDQQILGALRKAERPTLERRAGLAWPRRPVRRRRRPRERRLGAEPAGAIDRTKQDLQQVQHPAGLKAVGVGRDTAHGMHGHRPAGSVVVTAAGVVGPGNVERDLLLEGGLRQLARDAPDDVGGNSGRCGRLVGTVFVGEVSFGDQRERRPHASAIRQFERADQRRRNIDTCGIDRAVARLVECKRLALVVPRKQTVVCPAGIVDHQPGCIGVANQVVEVDLLCTQQFVDQCADEHAVGAGPDADPFVGDRAITGADRIDGDDLDAFFLELAERDLDRVGGVILGNAKQHEILGVLPVRLAELPERAAEGVEPGRRHVDRAEAAVSGEVDGAVCLRKPAGQRLALVAAGKEGELLRIARSRLLEPARRGFQRLVPGNFREFAGAARANPFQRRAQPRRRTVRHDAGRALAADHAAVDRMIAIAVDVADAAVLQVHADAAAARAHIAGGGLDLVGRGLGQRNSRFLKSHCATLRQFRGARASVKASLDCYFYSAIGVLFAQRPAGGTAGYAILRAPAPCGLPRSVRMAVMD